MSKRQVLTGDLALFAQQQMEEDIENCGCKGKSGPSHTRDFMRDGVYYAYQCDSRSRTIDLSAGEVTGRAHCSCDGCF